MWCEQPLLSSDDAHMQLTLFTKHAAVHIVFFFPPNNWIEVIEVREEGGCRAGGRRKEGVKNEQRRN